MTTIACAFTGWIQVRLATNPDPPDERRGISGYTFALPGEPDLDRLLRTSDPVAPRSHGPPIGVIVRRVVVDGAPADAHPLVGARFDLASAPRFESVNDVVMAQGYEALEPFDVRLTQGDFELGRRDYLDPARPDLTVYTAPPALLAARRTAVFNYGTEILKEATGGTDPAAFRAARLALLRADLATTKDPTYHAGLTRRIRELENTDPADRRTVSMQFIESRTYALNGPAAVRDPHRWLLGLDTTAPWRVDLTMGSWDADAMAAYATGSISLPVT